MHCSEERGMAWRVARGVGNGNRRRSENELGHQDSSSGQCIRNPSGQAPISTLCELVGIRSSRAHASVRMCLPLVNTDRVSLHVPINFKSLRGWRSQERESSNLSFRTSLEWRGPLHPAKLTPLRSLFAARSAPFAPFALDSGEGCLAVALAEADLSFARRTRFGWAGQPFDSATFERRARTPSTRSVSFAPTVPSSAIGLAPSDR
jgi:hypothetical protein